MSTRKSIVAGLLKDRLLENSNGTTGHDGANFEPARIDLFSMLIDVDDDEKWATVKDHLDKTLMDAKKYTVLKGPLQTLLEQNPGLVYLYKTILTDVQQSRRMIEKKVETLISVKYKYYMYSEEAAAQYGTIKTTDANKLAAADYEVIKLQERVRNMAYYEHHLENLVSVLVDMKYVIHDIITLKKEGISDVWIDPSE